MRIGNKIKTDFNNLTGGYPEESVSGLMRSYNNVYSPSFWRASVNDKYKLAPIPLGFTACPPERMRRREKEPRLWQNRRDTEIRLRSKITPARQAGYNYFGARYYNSELGRWMTTDPMADKYPGWSPYNYCLNNPLRFQDPHGDTVKIDPTLMFGIAPNEDGSEKTVGQMTSSEKKRFFFQKWWSANKDKINGLFGEGGKYEKTVIAFLYGPAPSKGWFESGPSKVFREKNNGFTTWGQQGISYSKYFRGGSAVNPADHNITIDNLQINIYTNNPILSTNDHEWGHAQIIFNSVQKNQIVPKAGSQGSDIPGTQHYMINNNLIEAIK